MRALLVPLLALGCSAPTELADVRYDARFGEATSLDLFLPAGSAGARPAVVLLHGGLFRGGDKAEFRAAAARLAASGFVAATVNYRLGSGAPFPAPVQDVGCALSFLRRGATEYGLDPDRVVIVGYASGAYLAGMLGVASGAPDLAPDCEAGVTGAPAGVMASAGFYDLATLAGKGDIQSFVGGTLEALPERYQAASPLRRVAPGAPPFLLIHGEFDFVVPPEQAHWMKEALQAQGDEVRLLSLFDPGHFLAAGADNGGLYGGGVEDRPESWIALIDFLEQTIGLP
ncbi:MAG: alpha/beta hydrolase [Minicystis sp.]